MNQHFKTATASAVVGGLLVWGLVNFVEARLESSPNVEWGTFGDVSFPEEVSLPFSHDLVTHVLLENSGGAAAEQIRIVLSASPHHVETDGFLEYSISEEAGRTFIDVPGLGAAESVVLTLFGVGYFHVDHVLAGNQSIRKGRIPEPEIKALWTVDIPFLWFTLMYLLSLLGAFRIISLVCKVARGNRSDRKHDRNSDIDNL